MITLHIEDTRITLMLVDGKQVVKVAHSLLEPGLVQDGEVIDKTAVSHRISELITSQNISDKQVVASITGMHSIYQTVSLPHLTREMVAEAARLELNRVMAVPLTELYTSWQAVDVSAEETILCLIGLQRNTVAAMMETLRLAGLRSISLDLVPLALARVADEADAIIINVQPSSFDIVIMVNGIPELLRSLTFPSRDVVLNDKVALIKEELERTVTFYNSSHQEHPLTGNIAAFVSGESQEVLKSSLNYRFKPLPVILSSLEDFDPNMYAVNSGLALKYVKDERIPLRVNIEATPGVYLPKPRSLVEVISWLVLAVVILLLIPFVVITQSVVAETSALTARVTGIEVQVNERQAANALLKMLQTTFDAVRGAQQATKTSLKILKSRYDQINGNLGKVTSLLPGNVNLISINYGDKVFIAGNAPNKATILDYSRGLRDTGRFLNVTISDMHEVDYRTWAFSITLE